MYREMKVEEALEEYLKGRNVVLMDIIQMPDEAVQYQGTELKDVFEGSVLLVDLPDGHDKEKTSLPVKGSPSQYGKEEMVSERDGQGTCQGKVSCGNGDGGHLKEIESQPYVHQQVC